MIEWCSHVWNNDKTHTRPYKPKNIATENELGEHLSPWCAVSTLTVGFRQANIQRGFPALLPKVVVSILLALCLPLLQSWAQPSFCTGTGRFLCKGVELGLWQRHRASTNTSSYWQSGCEVQAREGERQWISPSLLLSAESVLTHLTGNVKLTVNLLFINSRHQISGILFGVCVCVCVCVCIHTHTHTKQKVCQLYI